MDPPEPLKQIDEGSKNTANEAGRKTNPVADSQVDMDQVSSAAFNAALVPCSELWLQTILIVTKKQTPVFLSDPIRFLPYSFVNLLG